MAGLTRGRRRQPPRAIQIPAIQDADKTTQRLTPDSSGSSPSRTLSLPKIASLVPTRTPILLDLLTPSTPLTTVPTTTPIELSTTPTTLLTTALQSTSKTLSSGTQTPTVTVFVISSLRPSLSTITVTSSSESRDEDQAGLISGAPAQHTSNLSAAPAIETKQSGGSVVSAEGAILLGVLGILGTILRGGGGARERGRG